MKKIIDIILKVFNLRQSSSKSSDLPKNYIVIDLETTGLDFAKDKIIEVSALKIRHDKIVDSFSSLVNPNIEIPVFICNLTGITNEMVEQAPPIDETIKKFVEFIGSDILVGHNVIFDINFLNNVMEQNRIRDKIKNNYIDTVKISRNLIKGLEHYRLQDLTEYYGIRFDSSHRAFSDCIATYEVFKRLKSDNHQNAKVLVHTSSIKEEKAKRREEIIVEVKRENRTADLTNFTAEELKLYDDIKKLLIKNGKSLEYIRCNWHERGVFTIDNYEYIFCCKLRGKLRYILMNMDDVKKYNFHDFEIKEANRHDFRGNSRLLIGDGDIEIDRFEKYILDRFDRGNEQMESIRKYNSNAIDMYLMFEYK